MSKENDVFFHFPPVPTTEPGKWKAIHGSPVKKIEKITEIDLKYQPIEKLIQRVLECECDNALFGFDKHRRFTQRELTKAYRLLALTFHPDKTKIPGSEMAFKKISDAYISLQGEG